MFDYSEILLEEEKYWGGVKSEDKTKRQMVQGFRPKQKSLSSRLLLKWSSNSHTQGKSKSSYKVKTLCGIRAFQ
jgi:hypothetical protein